MRLLCCLLLFSGFVVGCGGGGNAPVAPSNPTPVSTEEKPTTDGLPAPPPLPPKPAN